MTPQGRRQRFDLLRGFGIELPVDAEAITHDQLDAAASAFGAYLWSHRETKQLGEAPIWDEKANMSHTRPRDPSRVDGSY